MNKQKKEWVLKNKSAITGDELIAGLLKNRGILPSNEDSFFSPNFEKDLHDPFIFRDMKKAVDRIIKAIKTKEKILIYGDYDVDGVTSTIMLNKLLTSLGLDCFVYLPHRENEGYGMNKDVIKKYADLKYSLLISVDCGTSNIDEVDTANKLGLDVIIFDHHLTHQELPRAFAIINPKLEHEKYPFKDLSAGGVIFKFIQGFLKHEAGGKIAEEKGILGGWEKWMLDLAAISTICDSMPLIGENRVIVKYGLIVIAKSRNIGLKKLMDIAGIKFNSIDTKKVGFTIGPRINAAGRMEHANLAFDLLNTDDDVTAIELAQRLNQANINRQKLVEKIIQDVRQRLQKQSDDYVCIAYDQSWPAGIVGLVAGKIKDEFYRPAFIIGSSSKEFIGSGRSIDQLNIMEVMEQISKKNILKKYGGHKMACGFSVNGESQIDEFRVQMSKIIRDRLLNLDICPRLIIDAQLQLEDISESLVGEVVQFEPFGSGNEQPIFLAKNIEIVSQELIGQTKKHMRMYLRDKKGKVWKVMGFGWNNGGEKSNDIVKFIPGKKLDIVYGLAENEWNGNREIQINLIDVKFLS